MNTQVSVRRAIWVGLAVVNGPVLSLLCAPLAVFSALVSRGAVDRECNWVGLPVLIASFLLAWLWWSVSVPRWRLWAYQRVQEIAQLKQRAVAVGLTWPDDHPFAKTELK